MLPRDGYLSASSVRPMSRRARPGFSLLEITLVLVIIGLLIGAAAVALGPAANRAKVRTTKASMFVIKNQLQSYQLENNALPPALSAMVPSYIQNIAMINDAWGMALYYAPIAPGQVQGFDLISAGEDGVFETEDDIDVWQVEAEQSQG